LSPVSIRLQACTGARAWALGRGRAAYWPPVTQTPGSPPSLRIVVPRYGEAVVGGAERLLRLLALSLVAGGWRVEVFTTCAMDAATWRDEAAPGVAVEEGVVVRRFRVRAARRPAAFHQLSRGFFKLPGRLRPEAAWAALQGPWSPSLLTALSLAAPMPALFAPYLYHPTLAGLPAYRPVRLMLPAAHDELPLRLGVVGRALAAADGLLFGTEEEREIVVQRHPQAAAVPWEVGNVGVSAPADVDGARFRAGVGLGAEEPYLLYGGRVAEGKGMPELLCGMALLRDRGVAARLVLTGEAGRATPPSATVLPVGMLTEADRWDALAGAAAVVVPSFHESLSLLALEAWAVGRPVLANAASPVLAGQVARSGGGIAYHGAEELAGAAARLLADPLSAAALGTAGQAWVAATYRWEAVHRRLAGLIAGASGAAAARAAAG
jgi:glycosyltransferase involved in cell wall biosynthesis